MDSTCTLFAFLCGFMCSLAGSLLEADAAEVEAEAMRHSLAIIRGERIPSNVLLVVLLVRANVRRPLSSVLRLSLGAVRLRGVLALDQLSRGVLLLEEGRWLDAENRAVLVHHLANRAGMLRLAQVIVVLVEGRPCIFGLAWRAKLRLAHQVDAPAIEPERPRQLIPHLVLQLVLHVHFNVG